MLFAVRIGIMRAVDDSAADARCNSWVSNSGIDDAPVVVKTKYAHGQPIKR